VALALIAEDLGERVARQTARQLVVYYRRPGGQSQFSALLEMERSHGRFARLLEHVRGNLTHRHSVTELAKFCCMGPRHFPRVFRAEMGITPAKAVERLRLEAARACGFGSAERMRRGFLRVLGSSPSALRRSPRA
jgi:transcriptional regulator GlxA family with amidase domain